MTNKYCKNCKSKNFEKIFSLGNLSFSGRFGKSYNENIPREILNLIICKKCKLVQLDRSFNPKYLYGENYGYRTGINKTMTNHVKKTVLRALKIRNLKRNDYVLDIASNDATLLNFYPQKIITMGIDPLVNKYKKLYKNINFKISNFFNIKQIRSKIKKKKFKVITALSVFYDLRDPNKFLSEVSRLLDKDGVFILEHADLYSIIKNNIYDTICHEHLCYFSSRVIIEMMKQNSLKVFRHEFNNINGGSSRYFICHKNSNERIHNSVRKVVNLEKKFSLDSLKILKKFYKRISFEKDKLKKLIIKIKKRSLKIHGYGASTKGNIILQYSNIGKKQIDFIADRNPLKYNLYTPGTKIKIISEKDSRFLRPDYFLVLPWHFKKEILIREKKLREKGVKFIFPLPKVEIK